MKKILLLLTIITFFITSCFDDCTFRNCAPPDFNVVNALVFNFDLNTTYTEDEIVDAHIVRYESGGTFANPIDTFYFAEQFNVGDYLMVLSDPEPFGTSGTFNLNSYEDFDYVIRPNHSGKKYKIKDIEVKGEFQDCECEYVNTEKTFTLDGIEMNRTNSNLQVTLN